METLIITLLILIAIIIISALPLHLAVKLLGGRTNIIKSFLITFATAILSAVVIAIFPWGGIIAFFLLIWIYHEIFRLKWYKAILAWILQIVFIILITFILILFGISLSAGILGSRILI